MKKEASKTNQSTKLSKTAIEGIKNKKGFDIVQLDLRKIDGAVADYFVIASANSDTQLGALYDSVQEEIQLKLSEKPWKNEGRTNKEWIVLDYGSVVIHLFKKDIRGFYDLESLWGDAKITRVLNEEEEII